MANFYTNVPNGLFDDLADGKINNKMFAVLLWLLRRADYGTGKVIKVSAARIQDEMWGDELEKDRPSLRTIQEILKRLDRSGYLQSHHIKGRRASYAVSLNNYSAVVRDRDGKTTNEVLRPVDTTCWRDLPEFLCGDRDGDPAGIMRGDRGDCHSDRDGDCTGDPSAYTSSSTASTYSSSSLASPASTDSQSLTMGSRATSSDGNVRGREFSEPVSDQASVPGTNSVCKHPLSVPVSLPDTDSELTPQSKQYNETVRLCSLWWATHPDPCSDTSQDASPSSLPHKWGHPRTWTPAQRRETFLYAERDHEKKLAEMGYDPDSLKLVVFDPAPEDDPDPELNSAARKEEDDLLRDERAMLELYMKEGSDVVEEVLRWLPKSSYWYDKISSLAELKSKFDWIFNDCQKYYQKAMDNGTTEKCEDYVHEIFLDAGGDAAESIEWERLHPLPPIVPADAAEERAMDAHDDAYGVELFNPWGAEHDQDDSVPDADEKHSGDGLFDPWAEENDSDPAGDSDTPHAIESDEVDDAEAEPPVYRYCEDCDSVHAGMCMPIEDLDFE